MGGGQSKYLSESEVSSAESDSEYFKNTASCIHAPEEMALNAEDESDERTDAALRTISFPVAENAINVETVRGIETELDDSEIVSLVYLLYDTTELALQDLLLLVGSGRNPDLLFKWAKSEEYKGNRKWQTKLIEALSIIQNYKILRDFGFDKVDLKAKYMPHRPEASCFINKIRKAFYVIAEKLGQKDTTEFICKMEKKVLERGFAVRQFSNDYLELYLLYWEQNHINIEDVKRTCKEMAKDELYDILNRVMPSETPEIVEIKPTSSKLVKNILNPKVRRRSGQVTRDTTNPQPRSMDDDPRTPSGTSAIFQEGPSTISINGYSLNPDNPGVVLIINQEEFYTELDPQYKSLLHEYNDRVKLETRDGTMMDKMQLQHVFGRRGFRIIVKENLPHYDIIHAIRDVVMKVSFESSLIVCVLSHGDNGVVYGANSCKVEVNQIQNIICKKNKNLRGKPKVLILQSCQGKQCQNIEEESSNEDEENANAKDGPSTIPSTADLLTFWATIPGFAAIRNKNKGSWLIQELCDEIEQLSPRYHFLDICTRVVDNVTRREWKEKTGTNIMTPMVVSTLRKPFFLPALKN